ncbi:hypothetical protein AAVH_29814 [Aphelenchoides avenae]|nr:hypothetical protein AAVH_29814 [Aphelenchus avenae]
MVRHEPWYGWKGGQYGTDSGTEGGPYNTGYVPRMSAEGAAVIRAANEKYLGMLSESVRKSMGDVSFKTSINRINSLLTLLSGAERVAQINDAALTMMSMFNYAGFQGSLTWDLHVKKHTS